MRSRRGFTLVELLVVITIIGILLSFILRAYMGTVRVAEKSATISLIAKLETALIDRIDALSSQQPDPTLAHRQLAAIWTGTSVVESNQRAQVIAKFDYMRAELPDVFVLDTADPDYKLNFGAEAFPCQMSAAGVVSLAGGWQDYVLPLGAGLIDTTTGRIVGPATGVKGASFAAASAIYKQLGFVAAGLDGADNDGDEKIDEWDEGIKGLSAADVAKITTRLANHTHKTARSEMLYALLIEGTGPLGSVFNRDDFAEAEIKDTDGDGLMEFVDAYGEPLQFYRWPIMFRSETQKGFPDLAKIADDLLKNAPIGPYTTVFESREQDPMDPNQQLQNPGWWRTGGSGFVNSAYPWGSPRATFGAIFHTIVDPLAASGSTTGFAPTTTINTYWDRSDDASKGYYSRRAYYSRFLVLSGGPDKRPGVAQLGVSYKTIDERSSFPVPGGNDSGTRDGTGSLVTFQGLQGLKNVIQIENQGGAIDPNRNASGAPVLTSGRNDTNTLLEEFGHDDISNHNLHSAGGPLPSGGR